MTAVDVQCSKKYLSALILSGVILFTLAVQGCDLGQPAQTPGASQSSAAAGTQITSTAAQITNTTIPTITASADSSLNPTGGYQPVWGTFPPPSLDSATEIPPPLSGLEIPDEALIWILLGSDTEPPFTGRTLAIHLVIVHPRFSKASLVSIPGDLYVYIPGYTMQRLSTAYALGGMETVRQTLAYNFGLSPSRFVLAHPGDFQWLVDDLNSIEVTVFFPMPQACGGIPAGRITMDGALALCYVSHRDDMDEIDRMRRQQQLLRLLFIKLASDGNLSKLPALYASYQGWVKTDFSLEELIGYIPLALRLADVDRISYYMVGWDQFTIWEIPGKSQARVFLPDRTSIQQLLQEALNAVNSPASLTDRVQTLEAQLTAVYEPTQISTPTPTPTGTITITQQTGTAAPPSPTPSPPGYP